MQRGNSCVEIRQQLVDSLDNARLLGARGERKRQGLEEDRRHSHLPDSSTHLSLGDPARFVLQEELGDPLGLKAPLRSNDVKLC